MSVCVETETVTLSITVDDQLVELYADGVSKEFEAGGWKVVRKVDIPRSTKVVAVKGIDVANVSKIVRDFFLVANRHSKNFLFQSVSI